MRRRLIVPLAAIALFASTSVMVGVQAGPAGAADPHDWPAPAPASPAASASTDGDFATDAYGDPWDFVNDGDLSTTPEVGVQLVGPGGLQRSDTNQDGTGGGWYRASVKGGSEMFLVFDWPGVLPWARDGRHRTIDANRYSRLSFSVCNRGPKVAAGVRWEKGDGSRGQTGFEMPAGCSTQAIDLANGRLDLPAPWNGTVTRLTLVTNPNMATTTWEFDWIRLHRADTPDTPTGGVSHVRVLTPNEAGQGDYATDVRGDAWDMSQAGDVALGDAAGSVSGGVLNATNTTNDPSAEFPVPVPFDGGDYHRATIDVCYDGGFSLSGSPGGGMVGRFQWITDVVNRWSESQDIVVFPGCQSITVDLRADPPSLIHDEASADKPGFCGRRVIRFRFDPHEDPAGRGFHIDNVRLAGDPHFTSAYDISFQDTAGVSSSADIYVSSDANAFDGGTQVAHVAMGGSGAQTFSWNGHDVQGNPLPAGSYWVFVVTRGRSSGSSRSTAPVRYDPPGGGGLGQFVGIQPVRVLDTRSEPLPDTGCHAPAFGGETFTVQVAGRAGVPAGANAVALNVTAVDPTGSTYVTVWPSGTAKPNASNLNTAPGQTIPNMVISKIGADGKVSMYNNTGSTHLLVDVTGYFTAGGGDRLTPISPLRTLDTRPSSSIGGRTTPLGAVQTLDVSTVAACGGASTGAALNVTAVNPTLNTYVTVWPQGQPKPLASNLNPAPGTTIPNMVIVRTTNGLASIYNNAGSVDLVVDVIGCFGPQGSSLNPVVPVRAMDTRPESLIGAHPGPLGQGESVDVTVTGIGQVPTSGVTAVALNLTGITPTAPTYLTVWPAGQAKPLASNLNLAPGAIQPNLVIAKVANGKVSVYNNAGATHIAVDVVGYFTG